MPQLVTKWQVVYLWQGERHLAPGFNTKQDAQEAAAAARTKFAGVGVESYREWV